MTRAQLEHVIRAAAPFHDTFGYYADGVSPETATLPAGWESRLVVLSVRAIGGGTVQGFCLEIHDLCLSKWVAGRERDLEFVRAAVRHGLVELSMLLSGLATLPVPPGRLGELRTLIEAAFRNPE